MTRQTMLLTVLCLCRDPLEAASDAAVLRAIAQVESGEDAAAVGDSGSAVGKYQQHPSSWADANDWLKRNNHPTYPRSTWRSERIQDVMAAAFLQVCKDRLRRHGIANPSPAQIAVVWNMGFEAARRRGFRPNDYALRVNNLCRY